MPTYRDIFDYLTGVSRTGGEDGRSTPSYGSGTFTYNEDANNRDMEGYTFTPPEKYKEVISVSYDSGAGEDPKASYQTSIDWSKLPNQGNTDLGHVSTLMPIDGPNFRKLKDPSLVTFDANYGWVTPQSNYKESFMEKASPYLAMAGGTALFGGAALGAAGLGAEAGGAAAGGMAAGEGGMLGPGLTSYLDLMGSGAAAGVGAGSCGSLAGAEWGGAQAGAGPAWVNPTQNSGSATRPGDGAASPGSAIAVFMRTGMSHPVPICR